MTRTDAAAARWATARPIGYDQFDTIQEAINAVAIGGEIHVYAGTYVETLTHRQVSRSAARTFF